MIRKATGLDVDEVFLDLEDSVTPDAKAEARGAGAAAVRDLDWGKRTVAVRINDAASPWVGEDLAQVVAEAGPRLDAVIVPKVGSPDEVRYVDRELDRLEQRADLDPIGIEVQIETAAGLVAVDDIVTASDRIETVIFGPGDMAASLGMPSLTVGEVPLGYPGDHWHYPLMRILVAARSAGHQAIDGPYAAIEDIDGYRASATRSRVLGYDGKWVIHPTQIEAANEVYGVSQVDFERASDIKDAYAAAGSHGRGAVMFGAEMIDEASRKMAERTFDSGLSQGLVARPADADVPFHERAAWREEHPGPAGE
jgi:citrate lyase subunit beta/citryl-CoA lyase